MEDGTNFLWPSQNIWTLKRCELWVLLSKKENKDSQAPLASINYIHKRQSQLFFPTGIPMSSEIPTAKDDLDDLISFLNFSDLNSDTICLFDRNSNWKTSSKGCWLYSLFAFGKLSNWSDFFIAKLFFANTKLWVFLSNEDCRAIFASINYIHTKGSFFQPEFQCHLLFLKNSD